MDGEDSEQLRAKQARRSRREVRPVMSSENKKSWNSMVWFYQKLLETPHLRSLEPLVGLVRTVADSDLSDRFRAGQSLLTLMVSTAPKHGLEPDEPFVSVTIDEAGVFSLEYWREVGGPILARKRCGAQDALSELSTLLERLWADTKGSGATP